VHKYDRLKIPIVYKHHEEWSYRQSGGYQITHKGYTFKLMRIEPNAKNIGREEQHRPKRNITRRKNGQKVEDKIGDQLKALAHQTVQHALGGFVYQVLFRIVKIVDDVPTSNG
tara:strand:+ start:2979 stop:3317 length:339 start_codon:yes stop_codon:yes gene_type:complete